MREFLFCAETRFYLADRPAPAEWGVAELDPAKHIIIRTEDPAFLNRVADLRTHKLRLAEAVNWTQRCNIFSAGILEETPERDWIVSPFYLNLRNGTKYANEEIMWDNAQDGDVVFYATYPSDLTQPGMGIRIISVRDRQFFFERSKTLAEVETWLS